MRSFLLSSRDEDDRVAGVIVEELKALHHPRVETAARVLCDLAHNVDAIA